MRLLVIGGTVFLGRHLVQLALAAGHHVTTLNRGTIDLGPEQAQVEKLFADRDVDLSVLSGRTFDAVIDTCGYHPSSVHRSLTTLRGLVGTYVFISTISVYGDFTDIGINEEHPIQYTPQGEPGNYGSLKADCEKVVMEQSAENALIIRPGLIAGPYDPTDRITYWPARFAKGGRIAIPARLDRQVQFIDARDLAAWTLKMAEAQERGTYIATGPEDRFTLENFFDACEVAANAQAETVRVEDAVLEKAEIQPWSELPLWIPATKKDFAGVMRVDKSKAVAAGLTCRPVTTTLRDILAWDQTRDPSAPRKAGLSEEKEAKLLKQPKRDLTPGKGPLPGAGLR
jgi:2'-hydroxyisoflavone reductase